MQNTNWCIYIPSKGRENGTTFKLIRQYNLIEKTYVSVDHSEVKKYKQTNPEFKILDILPKEKQGIGYNRFYITKHAQLNNYDFVFFIDDDIKKIYPDSIDIFSNLLNLLLANNLSALAINDKIYSFFYKKYERKKYVGWIDSNVDCFSCSGSWNNDFK